MAHQGKRANFALQGGGSHGAFTWGVLDRILEDGRLSIDAISGTSAGAMNAVVLADGLMDGGPDGAREHLERFWRAISETASLSPVQRTPFDAFTGNWSLESSPGYHFMDALTRVASPYQFNPLNINPLKELLEERSILNGCGNAIYQAVYFRHQCGNRKVRVFDSDGLTAEMVMASACLP